MTTSGPRVRVRGNWMECDHCGVENGYYSRMEATRQAHRHAETCPALRLAWLIRELEALRDGWTSKALYVDGSLLPPVSLERRIYRQAAADLTAIIDRAGRTG